MMLAIVLVTYAVVLLTDFRARLRDTAAPERALYLAMMAVSLVVLTLDELGVDVPSPAPPIEAAIHALFGIG